MKEVVKWYLSGLYKKPKGLKKPYNPILGETFRCYWLHSNGTKTFYIAEQVSHHPPVSSCCAKRVFGLGIRLRLGRLGYEMGPLNDVCLSSFCKNITSALIKAFPLAQNI